jgi:hypothetical protein
MSLYVSSRRETRLEDLASERRYDLALVSVGFEQRSRAIPEAIPAPSLGVGLEFPDRHLGDYAENHKVLAKLGYRVTEPAKDHRLLVGELDGWFEQAASRREFTEAEPFRVAVDISSMTRTRMAAVVEYCYAQKLEVPMIIDLLYAPAAYRPSELPPASWVQAAPVTPHLAGWDPDATKPLLAVVGLGYEPNAAEGVVDYLTPDESVIFLPNGRDPSYRNDVDEVNSELIKKAKIKLDYPVDDPYRLMLQLERLVLARIDQARVLFVPLGPKIFAAACMVVAERLHPLVSVWRFSAGSNDEARPAIADGSVCGIRLSTQPEERTGFDEAPRDRRRQNVGP